ncbi:potassium channel protein [bacterium]|nr:potassium channel protein [bacterium]
MKTVLNTVCLLLALTLFGTVGFRVTGNNSWLESLYLAIITLTTIGSRDGAQSTATMIFVIVYIVTGLGIFTFSAFQLGSWVVSADFREMLEKRRMKQEISQLASHSIVCGLGRMGQTICQYLSERNRQFVVIDRDEDRLVSICREKGWRHIVGDSTHDDVLQAAGVERASSLTTVLSTDGDNLFVVLSARMLNSKLKIIARAADEESISKFERAGATRVVSPFSTGAVKMARFMLNPSIEDFIEIADSRGSELELADIQLDESNPLVGRRLMETDLRNRGVMVIGIRRASGARLMPPPGDAVLNAGDCLFVFGNADAVNAILTEPDGAPV